jgi:ribonuclease HII
VPSQKRQSLRATKSLPQDYTIPQGCLLGIDEVGRGCFAGPVVVGAVILSSEITGLRDSKRCSKALRYRLAERVYALADATSIGWASAAEVDSLGLTNALRLAMQRAIDSISAPYDHCVIDGSYNFFPDSPKISTLIKADNLIPAVSAASIIAKVARDAYMVQQSSVYPDYGFERHVGYGTRLHREALDRYGITPLHRLSVKPVARLLHSSVLSADLLH